MEKLVEKFLGIKAPKYSDYNGWENLDDTIRPDDEELRYEMDLKFYYREVGHTVTSLNVTEEEEGVFIFTLGKKRLRVHIEEEEL